MIARLQKQLEAETAKMHQNKALLEVRREKLRELQVREAELLKQHAEQLVRRLPLRAPLAPACAACPMRVPRRSVRSVCAQPMGGGGMLRLAVAAMK